MTFFILIDFIYRYAIDRKTDVNRQFAIDGHGLVTTAKPLDRETIPVHRVHILAIDKGNYIVLIIYHVSDHY